MWPTYSGHVYLDGTDVMAYDDEEFRQNVRWIKMSLVPQAAMNALNPVIRVGDQVAEPAMIHLGAKPEEAMNMARKMFQNVGVPADFLVSLSFRAEWWYAPEICHRHGVGDFTHPDRPG